MRRTVTALVAVCGLVLGGALPALGEPPAARRSGPSTADQHPTREWKRPPTDASAPLPTGSGVGRRIVYSVTQQQVWLVDGAVQRTYLVSGRAGIPTPGTYHVFSKSRYSTSGSLRLEYMVRFARGRTRAIGFHSIPVRGNGTPIQSEAELGQYRSSGCVRQRLSDAAVLWDFAPVGTTVVVTR